MYFMLLKILTEEIKNVKLGRFIKSMMISDPKKAHNLIKSDARASLFIHVNRAALENK